ncbi:MAG: hypothetical protein IPO05_16790 [Flavobacteriales bacterium]|nr:hypothetical protein [Flavobacteriales bacterium]
MPRLIVHGFTIMLTGPVHRMAFVSSVVLLCMFSCSQQAKERTVSGLDNLLANDTLVLMGRFSDCGEWGGHHEVIKIFRQVDSLLATYERDTVKCPDPSNIDRRIVERLDAQLDQTKEERIVAYLQELTARSFLAEGGSNAIDDYVATRTDGGLEMVYWNFEKNWKGFAELKRSLFGVH